MTRRFAWLTAALLACSAPGAHAQSQVPTQAPGLWEHTFQLKNPEMAAAQSMLQAQLASVPPAQRQQIEDMLKSRGVTLGDARAGGGTSVKFCLTKEQAAKPPEARVTGDCKVSETQRSGHSIHYTFTCTRPQPMSGEGEVTYQGDKAYSGTATVSGQIGGRVQQTTVDVAGKWLGADCGDVKPVGAPLAR